MLVTRRECDVGPGLWDTAHPDACRAESDYRAENIRQWPITMGRFVVDRKVREVISIDIGASSTR